MLLIYAPLTATGPHLFSNPDRKEKKSSRPGISYLDLPHISHLPCCCAHQFTMAPPSNRKRSHDAKFKSQRPPKKLKRKQKEYHSDSDEEEETDFKAVNLLDSDEEDIHNATVEDIPESGDQSSSGEEDAAPPPPKKTAKMSMRIKQPQKSKKDDAKDQSSDEEEEEDDDDESDSEMGEDDDEAPEGLESRTKTSKSKRNDPNAFATSLSKILSTKLSTNKRSDPVLARSAAAHEASKAAMDSALEAKARKQLREQKKKALEKGRVKDVLVATTNETTGELETTTSEIMETERRLRKVAQRGVVKLFNAVRAAQVAAASAEKSVKREGVLGMNKREEKVNEMSKKGFLDLIASGGGGLSKHALEEA